jgi:two-component system cell cycle response regulator
MEPLHVLLIEDNPGDAGLIRLAFEGVEGLPIIVEQVDRLEAGLRRLEEGGIDAVLLDLSLPDSFGIETFLTAHMQAPQLPFVVLTGLDDQSLAVEAVRQGAQDFIVKGKLDGPSLARSLYYAVERQRGQRELTELAGLDELTGLHNRRAFMMMADHHLKLAVRSGSKVAVVFIDVDGLKPVNDTYGHEEGSRMLVAASNAFLSVVRESDIVARLGGDEFCILIARAGMEAVDALRKRLDAEIEEFNRSSGQPYALSLSLGAAEFDPELPRTLDELLAEADALMYQEKRAKHSTAH